MREAFFLSIAAVSIISVSYQTRTFASASSAEGENVVNTQDERTLAHASEDQGGDANFVAGMRFIPIPGRDFAMQETETTRGQWKAVMGKYPEELPGWNDCKLKEDVVFEDMHPVSCVSWYDANDFARKMNDRYSDSYRLPTEKEWSDAAGDIAGSRFGWCSTSSTQAVRKLKANNGLYDMTGNVWEWTSTSWEISSYHNMIRGAAWLSDAEHCRSSNRGISPPEERSASNGFRLVMITN